MEAERQRSGTLRIGELASRARTSTDTIRYYEQLGLMGTPARSPSGYRIYGEDEVRRLLFIRRAKLLGFALDGIRDLLGLAEEGECRPLRSQVAELLRREIEACEVKLAEVRSFKETLETYYRLAVERHDQPACNCAAFPESCGCLPIQPEEVAQ